jgi:hypothetical protein
MKFRASGCQTRRRPANTNVEISRDGIRKTVKATLGI